jgi:hypothetical protein
MNKKPIMFFAWLIIVVFSSVISCLMGKYLFYLLGYIIAVSATCLYLDAVGRIEKKRNESSEIEYKLLMLIVPAPLIVAYFACGLNVIIGILITAAPVFLFYFLLRQRVDRQKETALEHKVRTLAARILNK